MQKTPFPESVLAPKSYAEPLPCPHAALVAGAVREKAKHVLLEVRRSPAPRSVSVHERATRRLREVLGLLPTVIWPWVNTPCCRGAPPPSVTNPCRAALLGAPPILLTGMLRNSKQADTLRFHEGECAKYRKKMRVQQAVNPEASIVQERGLGFEV